MRFVWAGWGYYRWVAMVLLLIALFVVEGLAAAGVVDVPGIRQTCVVIGFR